MVAGCVILPQNFFSSAKNRKSVERVNDSKQFSEDDRYALVEKILCLEQVGALYGATGWATVREIEENNIVGATCLAMKRAMEEVARKSSGTWSPMQKCTHDLFEDTKSPSLKWAVLVDGRAMKRLPFEHDGLIKGDTLSLAISMASLLAKVSRDRFMKRLHKKFPQYSFDSNKGYGSPVHLEALRTHGPTSHHRRRFLRNLLNEKS